MVSRVKLGLVPFFAFTFVAWTPTACSLETPAEEPLWRLVRLRGSCEKVCPLNLTK